MNIVSDLITPQAAAAEALGVTKGTLNVWRCTKRYALPFVKIGRKVFYKTSEVKDFIKANTFGGHEGGKQC